MPPRGVERAHQLIERPPPPPSKVGKEEKEGGIRAGGGTTTSKERERERYISEDGLIGAYTYIEKRNEKK